MNAKPLGDLPDELLLDVVEYLDTARDVAHFAASNRRVRDLIAQNGWKTFVKARFPSLTIPANERTDWSDVARRATYQSLCWEKRGFWMSVVQEKGRGQRGHRRPVGGQSVQFQSVLDVRLNGALDSEVLAAGVGENLIVRVRGERGKDVWHQVKGKEFGYGAGTGDVTAVSVVEREGVTEVVVGRANGDVQILSGDGFAETRQSLRPVEDVEVDRVSDPMRKSPGQLAVSWTEWQPQSNLLASCKGSVMTLYDLTYDADKDLSPVAYHDFSRTSASDEASLVRGAKFLSKDVMACALGGSREPIQWSQITPYGIEFLKCAKNQRLCDGMRGLTTAAFGEKITVRAIEPVRGGGSESLLLSAWDDGTYRLFDIRTPSPQDAIYRDRFQPYEAGSSLLVYGTERFVAGSNTAPDIRLFDFRYPKPYNYTTALPCSKYNPFPIPKSAKRECYHAWRQGERKTCNHVLNKSCFWHDFSRGDSWRPDATIHIGNPMYDRVYCLAKASDISSTVYCGLRGAFMEMNIQLTTDIDRARTPQTLPQGWSTGRPGGKISLIETGNSLCQADRWTTETQVVPELIVQEPWPRTKLIPEEVMRRHRLDYALSRPQDWAREKVEGWRWGGL